MCGADSTATIYDPNGQPDATPSIVERTLPPQPGDAQVQKARFNAILRQKLSGSRMASFLGSNILEGHSLSAPRADGYVPTVISDLAPAGFSPLARTKKTSGTNALPGTFLGGL